MVSAQERLTRTFTRSSHTYTRTERTEISKTRGGETKREVRVEKSTQVAGDPFGTRDPFGDFLGPEGLTGFGGMQTSSRQQLQEGGWLGGSVREKIKCVCVCVQFSSVQFSSVQFSSRSLLSLQGKFGLQWQRN